MTKDSFRIILDNPRIKPDPKSRINLGRLFGIDHESQSQIDWKDGSAIIVQTDLLCDGRVKTDAGKDFDTKAYSTYEGIKRERNKS